MERRGEGGVASEVRCCRRKVTLIARWHRLSESLLYNWRSAWKAALQAVSRGFLPVGVVGQAADDRSAPLCSLQPGTIEIVLPNGARLGVDSSVNEKALSRVFRSI